MGEATDAGHRAAEQALGPGTRLVGDLVNDWIDDFDGRRCGDPPTATMAAASETVSATNGPTIRERACILETRPAERLR